MKKQKAFTLIELLVVIAIIGLLASIVLASLGRARVKSQNSSVQATLSSLRSQAELYSSEQDLFVYDNLCADNKIQDMLTAMTDTNGEIPNCIALGNEFIVSINEAGTILDSSYCVDSSGFSGETSISSDEQDEPGNCQGRGGGVASGGE